MDGIWIPADVWGLDLPPLHRVFLARLIALSKQDGASWAGDEFLAESLRCTPQHVRKMRRQLEESGHIVTEGYGHKRRLSVELAPTGAKVAPTGTSNHRRKQPEAQELQPQAQELQPQMRQEATTDAESIEENRTSKELVKKEPKPKIEIVMPWESDEFADAWREWKEYKRVEKRFTFKSPKTEQTALHKLYQDAEGNEQLAIYAIGASVAAGWTGLIVSPNIRREFYAKHQPSGEIEFTAEYLQFLKEG